MIKKTPPLLEILHLNFSHVLSQCEEDECWIHVPTMYLLMFIKCRWALVNILQDFSDKISIDESNQFPLNAQLSNLLLAVLHICLLVFLMTLQLFKILRGKHDDWDL